MTEFHADGQTTERTIKIKDYKLIGQLNKDTIEGKLAWKCTYEDRYVSIFVVHHEITKQKKIMFVLRCSNTSLKKEDNVLRVTFKKESDRANNSLSVIKTIHLIDYPLLNVLIKRLNKTYLNKEFISPIKKEDDVDVTPKIQNLSKAVEVNTVEEYKKHILTAIKDIMKKLPGEAREWESKFMDVFVAYDEAKKAITYEELNDLLHKATVCAERNNPIGDPWWARR